MPDDPKDYPNREADEYIENLGGYCPNCNRERDIDTIELEENEDELLRVRECFLCGEVWRELLHVVHVERVSEGTDL